METNKTSRQWRKDAERRRAKRRVLELSLGVVAARIGINMTKLHRWEKCRYRPSEADAQRWELALFKEAE